MQLGDRITIMVPEGDINPAGMTPRMRAFKLIGIIDSGHYEFDSTLAVVHWKDAAALLRLDGPSGLRLKLDDMQQAAKVADQLSMQLPGLWVKDWTRQNKNWFAAVQTEKRMMFIILTLIIAVAAFNLVSTLVMTVTDKRGDIAILRYHGCKCWNDSKNFLCSRLHDWCYRHFGWNHLGLANFIEHRCDRAKLGSNLPCSIFTP